VYGIDVGEPGLLRERSWRWLRVRILGLISTDSRLARHLMPADTSKRGATRHGTHGR